MYWEKPDIYGFFHFSCISSVNGESSVSSVSSLSSIISVSSVRSLWGGSTFITDGIFSWDHFHLVGFWGTYSSYFRVSPKKGLNWPKLTNICKLCKVESVLPIVTASQQRRKKKLDKCIQTQWSVLPTVTVSQQARPFYIRDDYLSQDTKGNNWLRRM